MPRTLLLVSLLLVSCGGSTNGADDGPKEDDFTQGDYTEDMRLPYAGAWLDPPKALAGIGQFDRLRGTIHDDAKCSTMVAVAAAIVGGQERFTHFVDSVARRREGRQGDLLIINGVRRAIDERNLTPRHIHELTEVVVRAYDVQYGAYDEQIAKMVLASGYEAVKVGSTKPTILVDHLAEGEVVPLGVVSDNIPHITLLWKDTRGTVRLYDSDDLHGSHVLPRGSHLYRVKIEDPQSSWDLGEKYR